MNNETYMNFVLLVKSKSKLTKNKREEFFTWFSPISSSGIYIDVFAFFFINSAHSAITHSFTYLQPEKMDLFSQKFQRINQTNRKNFGNKIFKIHIDFFKISTCHTRLWSWASVDHTRLWSCASVESQSFRCCSPAKHILVQWKCKNSFAIPAKLGFFLFLYLNSLFLIS